MSQLLLSMIVGSFPVFQTLDPRPQNTSDILASFSLFLVTKPLPNPFLIFGIITSPIFVDFPLLFFTVLSSVSFDVLLVLLTKGSLAAGEPFPVTELFVANGTIN